MSEKKEVSDEEGFPLFIIPVLIGVFGLLMALIFSILTLALATPCQYIGETFERSCISSGIKEMTFSIAFWSVVLLAVSGMLIAIKEWVEEQVKTLNKQKQEIEK